MDRADAVVYNFLFFPPTCVVKAVNTMTRYKSSGVLVQSVALDPIAVKKVQTGRGVTGRVRGDIGHSTGP